MQDKPHRPRAVSQCACTERCEAGLVTSCAANGCGNSNSELGSWGASDATVWRHVALPTQLSLFRKRAATAAKMDGCLRGYVITIRNSLQRYQPRLCSKDFVSQKFIYKAFT